MAFIGTETKGQTYAPGWFLASDDEGCVRETRQIPQSIWALMDELMDALIAVNPRLYNSVLRKIE